MISIVLKRGGLIVALFQPTVSATHCNEA